MNIDGNKFNNDSRNITIGRSFVLDKVKKTVCSS